ncbi:MAG: hypothetical protein JWM12_2122 [Ilumatobacteraceae bacterium]|nr:hypothetical protein [Ilumatobacteraceae bacterium]
MTLAVDDIAGCYEGEIPALMCTSSADGTPNLVHISQVFRVDAQHVAISNQFLDKSIANLHSNPLATILCMEPGTMDSYRLLVRHVRTEGEGPTFTAVRRSIEAIAAMTGMSGVFALRAVEVLRVLHVEQIPSRGTHADR